MGGHGGHVAAVDAAAVHAAHAEAGGSAVVGAELSVPAAATVVAGCGCRRCSCLASYWGFAQPVYRWAWLHIRTTPIGRQTAVTRRRHLSRLLVGTWYGECRHMPLLR